MISKDESRNDEASQALLDLLSDYIYDSSILDASICLEFDPYDGTVYSALYCDRQQAFTYGESSGSETGDTTSGHYAYSGSGRYGYILQKKKINQ